MIQWYNRPMCKQKSKTFYNLLMSIMIYSSLSVGCIMNEGVEKNNTNKRVHFFNWSDWRQWYSIFGWPKTKLILQGNIVYFLHIFKGLFSIYLPPYFFSLLFLEWRNVMEVLQATPRELRNVKLDCFTLQWFRITNIWRNHETWRPKYYKRDRHLLRFVKVQSFNNDNWSYFKF